MLQNEYLVAKIGVDTAENEPSKVSGGSEFHPAVSHTDPTRTSHTSDDTQNQFWRLSKAMPYTTPARVLKSLPYVHPTVSPAVKAGLSAKQ